MREQEWKTAREDSAGDRAKYLVSLSALPGIVDQENWIPLEIQGLSYKLTRP